MPNAGGQGRRIQPHWSRRARGGLLHVVGYGDFGGDVRLDVVTEKNSFRSDPGSCHGVGVDGRIGFGGGDFVADTPIEEQSFVYRVNVEGVYRTTKAFAPLVIESKGRIITTGSIAGTLSWPGGSAYAGSKHWIEALTDALAGEMAEHGVSVSVVEPGNYKSNIRRTSVARELEQVKASGGEVTEEMKQAYEKTAERELSYKEPDEVTEAFMHALFSDEPLLRYMVVPNKREAERTIGTKINELVQLNQWSPHGFSRDELVQMLDTALNPELEE